MLFVILFLYANGIQDYAKEYEKLLSNINKRIKQIDPTHEGLGSKGTDILRQFTVKELIEIGFNLSNGKYSKVAALFDKKSLELDYLKPKVFHTIPGFELTSFLDAFDPNRPQINEKTSPLEYSATKERLSRYRRVVEHPYKPQQVKGPLQQSAESFRPRHK